MNQSVKIISYICVLAILINSDNALQPGKNKQSTIEDIKDFKKLLRSKTNVLVCFVSNQSSKTSSVLKVFKETSDIIRGHATMVIIDCNGNAKKMCRKLKVNDGVPFQLKHFKDGEFHKDYDRKYTVASMVNFMRDPTGGIPWEEDPSASDVIHLPDPETLSRFLLKGPVLNRPLLIMFFAPWCSYCKTLKPEFAFAATDLKGEAFLAAIDVSRPENSGLIQQYNLTLFPTLQFYENGKFKYIYDGENNRAALVEFMRDPQPFQKNPMKAHVPKEKDWALTVSDVIHLTSDTFEPMLKEESSALVVFHAPWCGHCKRIKPEYERAATLLKDRGINGMLAAVDATKEPELASKYGVKGYPTVKYFSHGEYKFDITAREEMKIVEFMKDPQEPTPAPPPEPMWPEDNPVVLLQVADFRSILKKKKNALVMFYAPWCSHCKRAKSEFIKLANAFKDDSRTIIAAADCTEQQILCQEHGVKGYPTIKYFSYFDKVRQVYSGGRTVDEMFQYLNDPLSPPTVKPKPSLEGTRSKYEIEIMTLTDSYFEEVVATPEPTLVMFYAPWCGHCASTKPAYEAAAKILAKEQNPAKLRLLDCTENTKIAELYGIKSYPTFKLFRNGKRVHDYSGDRGTEDFLAFMRNYLQHTKDEL